MNRLRTSTLFLLVFFGGFANLATEIIGPRLLASLFGSTTVVWAVVISVTLGGLSIGYALGGRLTTARARAALPLLLLANALWLVLVAGLVWQIPAALAAFNVRIDLGVIFVTVLLAFLPPSVLFGTLSPLVITLMNAERPPEVASRTVGNVYALSTIGSVLGALAAAFLLIPWVGLTLSLQVFAAALVLFAAYFWQMPGRWRVGVALLVVLFLPQPDFIWQQDDGLRLVAQREGYYQTIRVYTDDTSFMQMHLGPTFQSRVDLETGEPLFSYTETMLSMVGDVAGQDALVIGGAGHGMAHWLENRGARVTEVEIDPFVAQLSDTHFGPIQGTVVIADGRTYLERLPAASLDLVLVDAFDGAANVPPHLASLEFFETVERVLKPGGLMLYNFVGTPEGPRSAAFQAMAATVNAAFGAAGSSPASGTRSQNIILAGAPTSLDRVTHVDLPSGSFVLTDDRNPLDLLLSQARDFIYFRY